MLILILSIIFSVVACLAIAGFTIYEHVVLKRSWRWILFTPLGGLFMLILLFGSFCKVGANEVGIVYDDHQGILEETIGEGFKAKSIFWHVTKINTANRNAIVTTTGQTNDGQYATFTISLIYNIKPDDAGKFFKQTNDVNLSGEQLNNLVKQSLQSSTIKYDIFELLSDGLEIARLDFEKSLKTVLNEKYFVTLISTSFDEVDAGDNIEQILQQKAEAEQKIAISKKEAEANLIVAENEVKIAEQKATVERTLAEAEAYAIKTKAEATAEGATAYITKINEMIETIKTNTGLTYEESASIVLNIIFYDTWDGKLPEVLTNDSLSAMIGGLISNQDKTNQTT